MVFYNDPEDCEDIPRRISYKEQQERRERKRLKDEKRRLHNAQLSYEEAFPKACEQALTCLDRANMSSGRLRTKLTDKGFSEEVCDNVIEWVKDKRFINDRDYAHALVHDRFILKGSVGLPLRQELIRKGLDSATIDEAMASVTDDMKQDRLVELVQRRYHTLPEGLSYQAKQRRLVSYAARKGYSLDRVYEAVRHVCSYEHDDYDCS